VAVEEGRLIRQSVWMVAAGEMVEETVRKPGVAAPPRERRSPATVGGGRDGAE
jgi:uncharacterized membrane-anchored protein